MLTSDANILTYRYTVLADKQMVGSITNRTLPQNTTLKKPTGNDIIIQTTMSSASSFSFNDQTWKIVGSRDLEEHLP